MGHSDNRSRHRIAHRNLPQLLLKARERLMAHFRPIINHFGLTEQQWRILRALDEHGQLEPWALCEMCQILSPSMAGVLARMEDSGLVTRERMPEDQRRVMVRVARKGDQLLMEMAPLIDEQYQNIERTYGRRVFDELFDALEGFIEAEDTPAPQVALPVRKKSPSRKGG
ncbi:MAG TPA: homoprotocatechuate degradation operon regulator HpaR [Ramlibacter sp.]|nr:homoprotocatechuate degradation operon regulator HpaR [Ramlibacter sp.]